MNKKILGAVLGLTVLAASSAASAHVDLAIGVGIPAPVVVAPPPSVYVAPAVVPVGYVGYEDWRARQWHEREWRERQWRRDEWRAHHDDYGWRRY